MTTPTRPKSQVEAASAPQVGAAWLIEHPSQSASRSIAWVYSTSREGGSAHLQWTTDPNEAIRFATKEAAQRMCDAFRWPNDQIRFTEHKWVA